MYSYDYVNGRLLSDVYDEDILNKFLDFCQTNLWEETYSDDKDIIKQHIRNRPRRRFKKSREEIKFEKNRDRLV